MTPQPDDPPIDTAPGCCLGDSASRRAFLLSLLGVVATACAGPTRDASASREGELMAQAAATLAPGPTIDLHAHPGFFAPGELPLAPLQQMQEAHVDVAFFSVVGDGPVIRREPQGIRNVREPRDGELYQNALRKCARIR